MTRAIWKFKVYDRAGRQEIQIPSTAEILKLDYLLGDLFLWALVDPKAEMRPVVLYRFGTEQEFKTESQLIHLETVRAASCVWHWFIVH